ncbi:MAG: hypothetical protein JWM04_2347 [Verrucomicrobiales bacterium]|nr:hypothetical protein [Verrucomicrobiales bacterium]
MHHPIVRYQEGKSRSYESDWHRIRRQGLYLLALHVLLILGCQSPTHQAEKGDVDPAVLQGIAQAIDSSYIPGDAAMLFTESEIKVLQSIRFPDSPLIMHTRYYDRIKNVENCQVERFYLDYDGNVYRKEIVALPKERFWKRLELLARYYSTHGHFMHDKQNNSFGH